jgi:urea carboxylase-associated protein 2
MEPPPTSPGTATLEAARRHARAQAGAAVPTGATIPATAAVDLPGGVAPAAVRWDETVAFGGYAARRLLRGTVMRLTDGAGDACVNLHLINAVDPAERLNLPDTVKVQWQAYVSTGALLLSGQGRVLATVLGDTSGRHDALCGHGNRRTFEHRYGHGGIGGPTPPARDLLALGAARFGLTKRDLGAGLNLFKGVRVADDGSLSFRGGAGERAPGAHVDLRLELDVVVVLANAPHPLDPRPGYDGTPVRVTAWAAGRPGRDPFRSTTPERERAFLNTEDHLLGVRP